MQENLLTNVHKCLAYEEKIKTKGMGELYGKQIGLFLRLLVRDEIGYDIEIILVFIDKVLR